MQGPTRHNRNVINTGRRGRRGQVLVIMILAVTLLVGFVFYVYNVGDQINRRLELQNAADAAVTSGAGWTARSMNLIAMNNVTQSRMIALALVLDSIPLAAEMTVAEMTGPNSLPQVLEQQLREGMSNVPYVKDDFLRRGLRQILSDMNAQLPLLREIDARLDHKNERDPDYNAYDVRQDTQWIYKDRRGNLWRICEALSELSSAARASMESLSQSNADQFARYNRADGAFLLQGSPVQFRETSFSDFEPLFLGNLDIENSASRGRYGQNVAYSDLVERLLKCLEPEGNDMLREILEVGVTHWNVPGKYISGGSPLRGPASLDRADLARLGPFAQVYYWRDYKTPAGVGWGTSHFEWDTAGYTSYGPLEHAIRTVLHNFGQSGGWSRNTSHSWGGERLAYTTRFSYHVRKIAYMKLAYLFGLPSPQDVQYSDQWMTDYEEALRFHNQGRPKEIITTRYYRVVVDSKVPPGSPQWLTGEEGETPEQRTFWSWQIHPPLTDIGQQSLERWAWEPLGWYDPAKLPGIRRIGKYIWVRESERKVRSYWPFNWYERPIYDDQGNIIDYNEYTLYRVEWYVFGGMEIRDPVTISNPLEGASVDELPKPTLMETFEGHPIEVQYSGLFDLGSDGQPDDVDGLKVPSFDFLSVAWRDNTAQIWPQQFTWELRRQVPATVTVAQAKLFNNESWDLWTQGWQVQLCPVRRLGEWADLLNDPDYVWMRDYLRRLASLSETFMKH